jgi:hypothetical protein
MPVILLSYAQRETLRAYGHAQTYKIAQVALERLDEMRQSHLIGYHEIGLVMRAAIRRIEEVDPWAHRYVNETMLEALIEGGKGD